MDRTDYGPSTWSHLLRDQLDVSNDEFWACVKEGQRPIVANGLIGLNRYRLGWLPPWCMSFISPKMRFARMSRTEAIQRLAQGYLEQT